MAAFSPANLVSGIEPSVDRMLQARLFTYQDSQRYRLGRGFPDITVNKPTNVPFVTPVFAPVNNVPYRIAEFLADGEVGRYDLVGDYTV
jgi:catalase